jgi:hypothetical protein
MALVNINDHKYFFDCDKLEIKLVSNGRWSVKMDDLDAFIVVGGSKSGGARNEWFCHCPRLYGEEWVPTTSMVKAVKLGAQY